MKLEDGTIVKGAPIGAILTVAAQKAILGDLRAANFLAKYGYGSTVNVNLEDTIVHRGMDIEQINGILKRADEAVKTHTPPPTSKKLE